MVNPRVCELLVYCHISICVAFRICSLQLIYLFLSPGCSIFFSSFPLNISLGKFSFTQHSSPILLQNLSDPHSLFSLLDGPSHQEFDHSLTWFSFDNTSFNFLILHTPLQSTIFPSVFPCQPHCFTL